MSDDVRARCLQQAPSARHSKIADECASVGGIAAIRAVRWVDDTDADDSPDIVARVGADGAFEFQLPPGRYDLEAESEDGLWVAGLDGMAAVASDSIDDFEVAVVNAVSIEGRLVDPSGAVTDGYVEVKRRHQGESTSLSTDEGHFVFSGLRPGSYSVSASSSSRPGSPVSVEAPTTHLDLRVPGPRDGLLIVARSEREECPQANITLERLDASQNDSDDASGEIRMMDVSDCRASVDDVPPGSHWSVKGTIGRRFVDRIITFDDADPPSPICLLEPCDSDAADLAVRVIDETGRLLSDDAYLLEEPSNPRAWTTVTVRATAGDLTSERSLSLVPGVNQVVLRLPGTVPLPAVSFRFRH